MPGIGAGDSGGGVSAEMHRNSSIGRTGKAPNCHVAVDVDVEAFTSLLVTRLTKLDSELKLSS